MKFLNKLILKVNNEKRVILHSLRVTSVNILSEHKVYNSGIKKITGHKYDRSIETYRRPTDEFHRNLLRRFEFSETNEQKKEEDSLLKLMDQIHLSECRVNSLTINQIILGIVYYHHEQKEQQI
eukprot:Anaeramoba_ignava/a93606_20.p2 GENE.a93606_20~~a93606_20.p2  ORF type:complete len:124 (+),score=5.16 a93606_20:1074-1445(+)